MNARKLIVALTPITLAAACGHHREPERVPVPPGAVVATALPPIPTREGPLVLDLVYPAEGAEVATRDSTFVFGSTGTGRAQLRINGTPVRVEPNGAFLAFLPVPPDGVYRLEATADGQVARLERVVKVPPPPTPPTGRAAIIAGSTYPRGAWTALPGERIEVGFQGTPGGVARLVLPDGTRIPLFEERAAREQASPFEINPDRPTPPPTARPARYRGFLLAQPLTAPGLDAPHPTLASIPPGPGTGTATFELILGGDTARAHLPLSLAVLDQPRVGFAYDPRPTGDNNDGYVVGQPAPGTTELYFWPNGTTFTITGERSGRYRVRLASNLDAWVPADEVRLLPAGTPPPTSTIGAVRLTPAPRYVDVRIPLDQRLPFHVDEGEYSISLTLFGASSDTDWLFYGPADPLIERVEWSQPADGVYRLTVHLSEMPWGYLARWNDDGSLLFRIRRPPEIDPDRPLRGLLIAIDPGHPPAGAIGPTRLTEAEANLAIATRLRSLLEDAGARVLITRTDMRPLGLYDRPAAATRADADLFVSIHNNAFPDGVNPFENNGTSVYYFHPHSADLARALQRELLHELRLRDLGIGRASLAVVRWPTWFPAALTETMFLMIPQQEAALRNPEVQQRIARAHLRAIEAFLRERAAKRRPNPWRDGG
ncbi:MAG TPA: N-acetylmuramoyl-L-alanine amidase [Longimicrobiales bacterium]